MVQEQLGRGRASVNGTQEPCLSRSPAWLKSKELRTPFEGLGSPPARRSLTQMRPRTPRHFAMQQLL